MGARYTLPEVPTRQNPKRERCRHVLKEHGMRKRWLVYSPRAAPCTLFMYLDNHSGSVYDFSELGAGQRHAINCEQGQELLAEAGRDGFALSAPTVPIGNGTVGRTSASPQSLLP